MITRIGWRPNSKQVAFTLANVKTYGDVFSVDASLGTLTRWTTSEVGGFNPEVLPAPEVIEWKSFDGLAISGMLYKPPAKFSGPAAGHDQHSWRARSAGRCRCSSAAATTC